MLLTLLAATNVAGCGKSSTSPPIVAGGIVSLSPAATDLLVAMGLTDRVVGVSPYEANAELRRKLPKVGDYQRIDWERLAELRPKFLIVQGRRDRLPVGVRERCAGLGITPVILQIDRLDDVPQAVKTIGRAIDAPEAVAKCLGDFEHRRSALIATTQAAPVESLIVYSDSDSGTQVVGRGTFIDDALVLAGGSNVLEVRGYDTIDREKLMSLRPAAIFVILPGGTPAAVARATQKLTDSGFPATAVCPITDDDALMPGTAVLRLAETMARRLKAGA